MPVQIVRFTSTAEGAGELAAAIRAAFAAVTATAPSGIRYEYYRAGDDYVALLEVPEGAENPLLGLPAAQDLRGVVGKWATGAPPVPVPAEVLGSYDDR